MYNPTCTTLFVFIVWFSNNPRHASLEPINMQATKYYTYLVKVGHNDIVK